MSCSVAHPSHTARQPRIRLLYAVVISTWLVSACGGRWRTFMEVPDDGSTVAVGGRSGKGGASSSAGSSGAASGAGGAACDPNACMTPGCAEGESLTLVTGDCCPTCQPLCKQACDACPTGSHAEQHAGECCPACVKDTPESQAACAMGQGNYIPVRDRLAYKYSYGCTVDAECTATAPNNRCEQGCAYSALFYTELDSFTEGTRSEAELDCGMCSVAPSGPCAAPTAPHCYNGQCAFSPP